MKNRSPTTLKVQRLTFIYITDNKNFSSYLTENIARVDYKDKRLIMFRRTADIYFRIYSTLEYTM